MIRDTIQTLVQGISISREEAAEAMSEIMSGDSTDAQIAAFATALRMKGETSDEVAGMAKTMITMALQIRAPFDAIDTCGTGGDGAGTFNISTAAAFVLAGAGVPVAKHGNRAVSGSVGSADVLEELGIRIDLQPDAVAHCFEAAGIGFMFAPIFHPAMRFAASARREIGIRTIFNILGPIANPARVTRQVIGVADARIGELVANVQRALNAKHIIVCHGSSGLDEISLDGPTRIWELKDSVIHSYLFEPSSVLLNPSPTSSLQVASSSESAKRIISVLNGEQGPSREIVLANAAAGMIVGGKAGNFTEALALSRESIDSGKAITTLKKLQEASNKS